MTLWNSIKLLLFLIAVGLSEVLWAVQAFPEQEEPHAQSGLPQFNPEYFPTQLFWLTITFALLYFLLTRKALPRLLTVLEQRENRIVNDLNKAEELQRQAHALEKQNQQILSQAREQARQIAQEALQRIDAYRLERLERLDQEIADQFSSAEDRIARSSQQALSNAAQSAEEITTTILTKLVSMPPPHPDIVQAIATVQQSDS